MACLEYRHFTLAAKVVVDRLDSIRETKCCLVGGWLRDSGASKEEFRQIFISTGLDIYVLRPDTDQESIKATLVRKYRREFFLRRPKNPKATWMLLRYRIPETRGRSIKIDLLLQSEPAGEIPKSLHANHFLRIDNLPVAPLYFVLYHKLLGWQWRLKTGPGWRRKDAHSKDHDDIYALCVEMGGDPLHKTHMGRLYVYKDNFLVRAIAFCRMYKGEEGRAFRRIGFDV